MQSDDRSFLYGDGLFETVRVREDGQIRWLERHVARLRRSGEALGFPDASIDAGVAELEGLAGREPGLWRVTVSRAPDGAPFGGSGTVAARFRPSASPTRPHLGLAEGFYLPDDLLAEHKTTSYLRSVEVRRRARAAGFDDAVMTSRSGLVGEASCANVVVVKSGKAATPPIRGILPGVTREGVLDLADAHGRPIDVREVTVDELRGADEVVLLSAGVGLLAAASLEGRTLDDTWSKGAREWLP